jgi:hypothetical protein
MIYAICKITVLRIRIANPIPTIQKSDIESSIDFQRGNRYIICILINSRTGIFFDGWLFIFNDRTRAYSEVFMFKEGV